MKDLIPLTAVSANDQIVVAGPCAAESLSQLMECAIPLAEAGVGLFRAGVWKPRTKPGGFEGIGLPALDWLAQVKQATGLKIATEVATVSHVSAAIDANVDVVWIGARTTSNPFLVQEIADEIARRGSDVGVMVKNPMSPDLELWIGALQRFWNAGVRRLGAIHRGFTPYSPGIYRNTPHWSVPVSLHMRFPHLPLLCDPSHISGKRELVGKIANEAYSLGFSGLMVEVHPDPDNALSDAKQQLTVAEFRDMLCGIESKHLDSKIETDELSQLRAEIDAADCDILDALSRRMAVAARIGRYKKENGIKILQPERYNFLVGKLKARADVYGLDKAFLERLIRMIHNESVRIQSNLMDM